MRLTLRTLLAYMDDILDPEDREQLSAKIESSEFARDLLHKTRDAMRRLRLAAPPVADSAGIDENVVADYLDNTLPPEEVAEFERICLESDIHLAEVASCHEILTMVLGEPADIDQDARARMYALGSGAAEPTPAPPAAAPHPIGATEPAAPPVEQVVETIPPEHVATSTQHASEIPDYLRPSFFERHKRKLAVAAVLLVSAGAWWVYTRPSEELPATLADANLDNMTVGIEIEEDDTSAVEASTSGGMGTSAGGDAPPFDPAGVGEEAPPFVATPSEEDDLEAADLGEGPQLSPTGEPPSTATGDVELVTPPVTVPEIAGSAPATDLAAPLADGATSDTPSLDPLAGSAAAATTPDAAAIRDPLEAGGERVATTARVADDARFPEIGLPDWDNESGAAPTPPPEVTAATATELPPSVPSFPAGDERSSAAPTVTPGPVRVATYVGVGAEDMLVRLDPRDALWRRLRPRTQLNEGDLLIALPATRSQIQLSNAGVTMDLVNGTRVRLSTEDGMPDLSGDPLQAGVELIYGSVLFIKTAAIDTPLMLRIGDRVDSIEFESAATLAINVHRALPNGADPLQGTPIISADFYLTSGTAQWIGEDGSQEIAGPAQWRLAEGVLTDPQAADSTEEFAWVDSQPSSRRSDMLAISRVVDAVPQGGDVKLALRELVSGTTGRYETRSLASRMSVHVGNFDPFVASLNDSKQYSAWNEHIETLREALALGPDAATRVREAFVNRKGEERGGELFEMLGGYDKQQLLEGALAKLVHALDDESLDFRVIAFHNLQDITGIGLHYRPHDNERARRRAYMDWRERLDSGQLVQRLE